MCRYLHSSVSTSVCCEESMQDSAFTYIQLKNKPYVGSLQFYFFIRSLPYRSTIKCFFLRQASLNEFVNWHATRPTTFRFSNVRLSDCFIPQVTECVAVMTVDETKEDVWTVGTLMGVFQIWNNFMNYNINQLFRQRICRIISCSHSSFKNTNISATSLINPVSTLKCI